MTDEKPVPLTDGEMAELSRHPMADPLLKTGVCGGGRITIGRLLVTVAGLRVALTESDSRGRALELAHAEAMAVVMSHEAHVDRLRSLLVRIHAGGKPDDHYYGCWWCGDPCKADCPWLAVEAEVAK